MKKKDYIEFNFFDVEYSHRINPIQNRYIRTLDDAFGAASVLVGGLYGNNYGHTVEEECCRTAAENILAAAICFFCNYEVRHYDRAGRELSEKLVYDEDTGLYCYVFYDEDGNPAELHCTKGRYADLPHVLAFLMDDDCFGIFDTLLVEEKTASLVQPFRKAMQYHDYDWIDRVFGTLRVYLSRLVTPEIFWVLSADDRDDYSPGNLLFCEKKNHWGGGNVLNDLIVHVLRSKSPSEKIRVVTERLEVISAGRDNTSKLHDLGGERDRQWALDDNFRRIIRDSHQVIEEVLGLNVEIDLNFNREDSEKKNGAFTDEELAELFKIDDGTGDENTPYGLGSEVFKELTEGESLFAQTDRQKSENTDDAEPNTENPTKK